MEAPVPTGFFLGRTDGGGSEVPMELRTYGTLLGRERWTVAEVDAKFPDTMELVFFDAEFHNGEQHIFRKGSHQYNS